MYAAHALCFVGALLDDAFISFRYAHNLERGLGLVFNAGERVEGYTNFAWVCLAALGLRLQFEPLWLMPALALSAGVALTWLVAKAARALAPGDATWLGPLLVATHTGLAFYAASGLETLLFSVLLTGAAWALVERRAWTFASLTSLSFCVRPEAALIGVLGSLLFFLDAVRDRARARGFACVLIGFCVLLVPYLSFKFFYFGQLAPNTLAAKEPQLLNALDYVMRGLLPSSPLILVALILHLRDARAARQKRGEWLLLWAAYVVAAVMTGPDWMPAHRLLAHAFPLFAVASNGPLSRALQLAPRSKWTILTAGGLVLYLGVQAFQSTQLAANTRTWADRDDVTRALAKQIVARRVKTMATINIGLLGYEAPDVTVIDLVGLTDRTIAAGPGGHLNKAPSDSYLLGRDIDLFILTSSEPIRRASDGSAAYVPDWPVEAYVFARPWFNERYGFAGSVPFSTQHYYHLFERRRPPTR
jgi:hypothetical protein